MTRSLEHKQEQLAKSQKKKELSTGLGLLSSPNADPLTAEPCSTLPLWRRVDKLFWWDEWMSKQFVDAGVC